MNGLFKKTRRSGIGAMASNTIGVPSIKGMCGTVTTGSEVTVRRTGNAWAERDRQRRYFTGAQVDGDQRMEESQQPRSSGTRTHQTRIAAPNARWQETTRLPSVRMHPLPNQLQSKKSRRQGFSHFGLHGVRRESRTATDRNQTGQLATHKEGRSSSRHGTNSSPIRGRTRRNRSSSSRHGTNSKTQNAEITDFVPPRDKTPCFWGVHRPRMGHLYRLTICSEISGAHQ